MPIELSWCFAYLKENAKCRNKSQERHSRKSGRNDNQTLHVLEVKRRGIRADHPRHGVHVPAQAHASHPFSAFQDVPWVHAADILR